MADFSLENLWRLKLSNAGWNDRSSSQFQFHLAKSTRAQYNAYISQFHQFCVSQNVSFPCVDSGVVANYLCFLCDKSERPKSVLCANVAAINKFFDALDLPVLPAIIHSHVEALIKSGTVRPMLKTAIMPVQPFHDLFMNMQNNMELNLKELRMKCICLLALVFMARPSDFAPRAEFFDADQGVVRQHILSLNDVKFTDLGVSLTFHGIKNDYLRDGFCVEIPSSEVAKLDPVACLKEYIFRSEPMRQCLSDCPLFLTLRRPYKHLDASSVRRVLNEAISCAGLSGFSAKCFRPTGATNAIKLGLNPDTARHVGRWKSADTFEKHYVHRVLPDSYTTSMLSNS